ncbi:MAG: hypothetical protein ACQESR_21840 [Planctomycetota bacterium]
MESCPTQAVLPLVGLAAEKVIRGRYTMGMGRVQRVPGVHSPVLFVLWRRVSGLSCPDWRGAVGRGSSVPGARVPSARRFRRQFVRSPPRSRSRARFAGPSSGRGRELAGSREAETAWTTSPARDCPPRGPTGRALGGRRPRSWRGASPVSGGGFAEWGIAR